MAQKLSAQGQAHVEKVMKLFAAEKLRSSDGKIVKDRQRALAIAYSEARAIVARGAVKRKGDRPGPKSVRVRPRKKKKG